MPRYLNTDNGQVLTVADHEALIYEAASNFRLVEDVPVEQAAPALDEVEPKATPPAPKRKAPAKKKAS